MNIKKQLIDTFKNLLGVYFEKVYSYQQIKISEKEVGGKVEEIKSDGSLQVIPDGDYVMDDGFAFTVKDGQIVEIVGEKVSEEVEVVEAGYKDKDEEKMEDEVDVKDVPSESDMKIKELESKISELESKMDSILSAMEVMKSEKEKNTEAVNEFSKQVSDLNSTIKKLAKVPVEFTKTSKTPTVDETKLEKMNELASIFGSIKK